MTIPVDYQPLVDSFVRNLRAVGRADDTIDTYVESVTGFKNHLAGIEEVIPTVRDITADHFRGWMIALEEAGRTAGTRNNRYRGVQAFCKWLMGEGELDVSPLANVKVPSPGEPEVNLVPPEHMTALIATCGKGRNRPFDDVRDEAIIRLFAATAMRRSEMVGLQITDLDLDMNIAYVLGKGAGKGARPRPTPFGPKTAMALDRYLRIRHRHPKAADTDALWLGRLGPLGKSGVRSLVERRCRLAGIPHIHPHQFRHTFSDEWLANGGEEGDLMRNNGWKSRSMVDRYARVAQQRRAIEAYRRLRPGENY